MSTEILARGVVTVRPQRLRAKISVDIDLQAVLEQTFCKGRAQAWLPANAVSFGTLLSQRLPAWAEASPRKLDGGRARFQVKSWDCWFKRHRYRGIWQHYNRCKSQSNLRHLAWSLERCCCICAAFQAIYWDAAHRGL